MSSVPPTPRCQFPTDRTILELLAGGNHRRACEHLVARETESVYSLCSRMLSDAALAEDVSQRVFLEVWRDLNGFEERSSLHTWVMRIAAHRALDAAIARRRQRRNEATWTESDPVSAIVPLATAEIREEVRALEGCLDKLSERVRATLLARYLADVTYPELSQRLDEQPATLQARVVRGLVQLRECMEQKGVFR